MSLIHKSILHQANDVARRANLDYIISSLKQCDSTLYVDLYKSLTTMQVTWKTGSSEEDKCQLVVDSLEEYLSPYISLDHIKGLGLAQVDELTVKNMLDIFSVLFKSCTGASEKMTGISFGILF